VRAVLADIDWNADAMEESTRSLAETLGVGAGKLFQPLRVALTGTAASPGIFDVLLILGRERSLRRIDMALEFLRTARP
jgi:glutamyl-tRNA synthetase